MGILTGRKNTSFSHFRISVIPYPLGTKFATELSAIQGSLHTKFEGNPLRHNREIRAANNSGFFFLFLHTCKNCYKTKMRTLIALKFDTQKRSPKANPSIKLDANPMNGLGVTTNYSRKTR